MALAYFINFILNLAALLLWISWRVSGFKAPPQTGPVSLASTLKPMEPEQSNRWLVLLALLGLLTGRCLFYWQAGQQMDWVFNLRLVVVSLPFRSDHFDRMLLYSFLSFGLTFFIFYNWLLLLSTLNHQAPAETPWHRAVQQHLGWLHHLPVFLKPVILPILAALAWRCLVPFLYKIPPASGVMWEQSVIVALLVVLTCKYLLLSLFLLHLVNNYLYLGSHSFWKYLNDTTALLLRPLQWLRFGQVDLAPIGGILIVWLGCAWLMGDEWLKNLTTSLFRVELWSLPAWYQHIST